MKDRRNYLNIYIVSEMKEITVIGCGGAGKTEIAHVTNESIIEAFKVLEEIPKTQERNPFENSVPTFNITNRYDYLHEPFLNGPVFPQKRRTNLTPKKKKKRKK